LLGRRRTGPKKSTRENGMLGVSLAVGQTRVIAEINCQNFRAPRSRGNGVFSGLEGVNATWNDHTVQGGRR
jgi:hypothetical protein